MDGYGKDLELHILPLFNLSSLWFTQVVDVCPYLGVDPVTGFKFCDAQNKIICNFPTGVHND